MLQNEGEVSSSIGKKRHRPKSLNLNDTQGSNSDLALRIVSPGLPPLTREMQSTVVISQKIQQQQKNLIAARHGKNSRTGDEEDISKNESDSEKSDKESDDNTANSSSIIEISKDTGYNDKSREETLTDNSVHNNFDEMDSASASMSPKRLRREKVPTRLNISSFSGNMGPVGYSSTPIIQSAPIRPSNKFPIPITNNPQSRRRYVTTPSHSITSHFQASPYVMPVQRRPYVLVPLSQTYSPVLGTHEELQYQKSRGPLSAIPINGKSLPTKIPSKADSKSAPKGKHITVTDVYHGDYTKIAPLNSQPLSAQKDYFDKSSKSIDEDRSPVTDSEVKEMQEKYKGDAVNEHYVKPNINESNEMFGTINIMNESVFNFKIFNQKPDAEDDSKTDSSAEDYAKEKEKFMKICERTWDEFINNRKADP